MPVGKFQEIKNALQHPGEPFRRCFWASGLDLAVWYDAPGGSKITGFQLSYAAGTANEHVITWLEGRGTSHTSADMSKRTYSPLLRADGTLDQGKFLDSYKGAIETLELPIRDLIISTIQTMKHA